MERPILFSAPMVGAILKGKKTSTRRIVKQAGTRTSATSESAHSGSQTGEFTAESTHAGATQAMNLEACPFGQPGQHLWLKESYYAYGRWEARLNQRLQRTEWHFIDLTLSSGRSYQYEAPADYVKTSRANPQPCWRLQSGLFMPRQASRITLEITDVHLERLRDISEEQAQAEGFSALHDGMHGYFANHLPPPSAGLSVTAVIAFAVFWQSLYGKESWDDNPWVWVIGFQRLTP